MAAALAAKTAEHRSSVRPPEAEPALTGEEGLDLGAVAGMPAFLASTAADIPARAESALGNARLSRSVLPTLQRRCKCGGAADASGTCAECAVTQGTVQRREADAGGPSSLSPSVIQAIQSGGGERLPDATRAEMEHELGSNLRDVRIHTDFHAARAAEDINAHAFTVGQDVYFGAGQYEPGSKRGTHLLAHELTHTVQQAGGRATPQADTPMSRPGDPLEREAEAVAERVSNRGRSTASSRQTRRPRLTTPPMVQGAWYDFIVDAGEAAWEGAEWVGGKVKGGAKAAWRGAKWVGGKIADEALRVGGAAWDCAKVAGRSIGELLTLNLPSLQDLGIPKPEGDTPIGTMDVIMGILRHPCLRMIPGYTLFASAGSKLQDVYAFLKGAWEIMQDPDRLISAIRDALNPMMSGIPDRVRELAQKAITFSDPPRGHLMGIWRHLEPKLEYLGANWWEVLKDTGWDLLWPWPGVAKDFGEIWTHIKAAGSDIWDLEISSATDHLLAAWRLTNQMIGRLYGWFFIASVLVGAILGAIFGAGAGALPGAAAGAKFALAVGQVLLYSTIAAETLSIAKAGFDLVHGKQSAEKNEEDYEQIANSSIVLAITGVLYVLGVIAARFARSVINRVAGRVWGRPALRGSGTTARGDIIEIRVTTAARVMGFLRRYRVTWLESIRRNFPVIDLVEGGQINVTPRPGRAPLYRVTGGRIISVKSTAQLAGNAQAAIQGWVDELANFTTVRNVSVSNPAGRTLMVAAQTPLDAATTAAVRAYATGRGVALEMFTNLPANHPALVFPDAIPAIMSEAGVVAADEAKQSQEPAAKDEPAKAQPDLGAPAGTPVLQRKVVTGALNSPPGREADEGTAREAARRGLEGANEPLPHLDRIQASFGDHDLLGVRAQVGGTAARANDDLGAVGYTLGERVAFRSAPDLRLAAHEAAHVIQQRSGVSLENGVDRPGDEYERHADRVADAVARGEEVEPLVAQAAGTGSAPDRRLLDHEPAHGVQQSSAAGNSVGQVREKRGLSPITDPKATDKQVIHVATAGVAATDSVGSLTPLLSAGNQQILQALGILPALALSAPTDPDEVEADLAANAFVARAPLPIGFGARGTMADVRRECSSCEGERISRTADGLGASDRAGTAAVRASDGERLPPRVRVPYERFFGADLSAVRVHSGESADSAARSFSAIAFTHGSDIYFRDGHFDPSSTEGRRLLAHELAHVSQQRAAGPERVQRKVPDYSGAPAPPDYDTVIKALRELYAKKQALRDTPLTVSKQDIDAVETQIQARLQDLALLGVRLSPDRIFELVTRSPGAEALRQINARIVREPAGPLVPGDLMTFHLVADWLPPNERPEMEWRWQAGADQESYYFFDPRGVLFGGYRGLAFEKRLDEEFWIGASGMSGEYSFPTEWERAGGFFPIVRLHLGGRTETIRGDWVPLAKARYRPFELEADPQTIVGAPVEIRVKGWTPHPGRFFIEWEFEEGTRHHPFYQMTSATFRTAGRHTVRATLRDSAAVLAALRSGMRRDSPQLPVAAVATTSIDVREPTVAAGELLDKQKEHPTPSLASLPASIRESMAAIGTRAKMGGSTQEYWEGRLEAQQERLDALKRLVPEVEAARAIPKDYSALRGDQTYTTPVYSLLIYPDQGGKQAFQPLSVHLVLRRVYVPRYELQPAKGLHEPHEMELVERPGAYEWQAQFVDVTSKKVLVYPDRNPPKTAPTPAAAIFMAIEFWKSRNPYPTGGTVFARFDALGKLYETSFETSTPWKIAKEWVDGILMVGAVALGVLMLVAPEATVTKVLGVALLALGTARGGVAISENLSLGYEPLDEANILEAVAIVTNFIGLGGGVLRAAGAEARAVMMVRIGSWMILASAAANVGTFVYASAEAIEAMRAATADPTLSDDQRQTALLRVMASLLLNGLLLIVATRESLKGMTMSDFIRGSLPKRAAAVGAKLEISEATRLDIELELRRAGYPPEKVKGMSAEQLLDAYGEVAAKEEKLLAQKQQAEKVETETVGAKETGAAEKAVQPPVAGQEPAAKAAAPGEKVAAKEEKLLAQKQQAEKIETETVGAKETGAAEKAVQPPVAGQEPAAKTAAPGEKEMANLRKEEEGLRKELKTEERKVTQEGDQVQELGEAEGNLADFKSKNPKAKPTDETLIELKRKANDAKKGLENAQRDLARAEAEVARIKKRLAEIDAAKKEYYGDKPWRKVPLKDPANPDIEKSQAGLRGEIEMSSIAQAARFEPLGKTVRPEQVKTIEDFEARRKQWEGRQGVEGAFKRSSPELTEYLLPESKASGDVKGTPTGGVGELKTTKLGERQLSDAWTVPRLEATGVPPEDLLRIWSGMVKLGEVVEIPKEGGGVERVLVKKVYVVTDPEGTRFYEVKNVSDVEVQIGKELDLFK